MNISFFLDVKLIEKNNLYYTTGAVDFRYLNNHKFNKKDHLTVFCRKLVVENCDIKKMALASGENIDFVVFDNYIQVIKSLKIIKENIKKTDFCYTKLPSIIGMISCIYVNKYKKKQIVEMVGCPWDAMNNFGTLKTKVLAPILYLLNRIFVKKSKNIIYVTSEFLERRYPTKGNYIACSDVNIPEINREIIIKREEKIKNMTSKIKFGLIGSLDINYKGHDTAIKAMAKLKDKIDFEMHFLGNGDKARWIEMVKQYEIEDKVFFDGTLPSGEKVFEWLDDIDIYIIPSLLEGLPRALVEAMSRGCPAIGSRTGGIPELIDQDCVFKRKDADELAKIILKILNDKEYMAKVAKNNFEKSKEFEKSVLDEKRKRFINSVIEN